MEKCIGCSFYDRQAGKEMDTRGVQWGQCRRSAPMLHPVNQKTYMIEGVWPHVRDDDWCGEYRAGARRAEMRPADALSLGPLIPVAGAAPMGPRPVPKPSLAASSSIGSQSVSGGFLSASGRGD